MTVTDASRCGAGAKDDGEARATTTTLRTSRATKKSIVTPERATKTPFRESLTPPHRLRANPQTSPARSLPRNASAVSRMDLTSFAAALDGGGVASRALSNGESPKPSKSNARPRTPTVAHRCARSMRSMPSATVPSNHASRVSSRADAGGPRRAVSAAKSSNASYGESDAFARRRPFDGPFDVSDTIFLWFACFRACVVSGRSPSTAASTPSRRRTRPSTRSSRCFTSPRSRSFSRDVSTASRRSRSASSRSARITRGEARHSSGVPSRVPSRSWAARGEGASASSSKPASEFRSATPGCLGRDDRRRDASPRRADGIGARVEGVNWSGAGSSARGVAARRSFARRNSSSCEGSCARGVEDVSGCASTVRTRRAGWERATGRRTYLTPTGLAHEPRPLVHGQPLAAATTRVLARRVRSRASSVPWSHGISALNGRHRSQIPDDEFFSRVLVARRHRRCKSSNVVEVDVPRVGALSPCASPRSPPSRSSRSRARPPSSRWSATR